MTLKSLVGDPAWMFDLGFSLRRFEDPERPLEPASWTLDERYELPGFAPLSERNRSLGSRMAWSERAIYLEVRYPRNSLNRNDFFQRDDCLKFFIDTRSSPGVHRATHFCHCLEFRIRVQDTKPFTDRPLRVESLLITRAKSSPVAVDTEKIAGWCSGTSTEKHMKAYIPVEVLAGCDPMQFPEWGVLLVVHDLNGHAYALARSHEDFPIDDPSMWCRARLSEARA